MTFRSISSAATSFLPSLSVNRPAGAVPGDRLIAVHIAGIGADDTLPPPSGSGWRPVRTITQTDPFGLLIQTRVWQKTVSAGSEPSRYTFEHPPFGAIAIVAAVSAVSATASPLSAIVTASNTPTQITTPGVAAPGSGTELRIVVAGTEAEFPPDWTRPPGHTLRATRSAGQLHALVTSREIEQAGPTGSAVYGLGVWTAVAHAVTVMLPTVGSGEVPQTPQLPDFAPTKGSALYRYTVHNLLDGEYRGEIDPVDVKFDARIGEAGTFSATLEIPNQVESDLVAQLIPRHRSEIDRGPGPLAVHVWRGGDLWGWYWLTGAVVSWQSRGTPRVELRGASVEAYLLQVEIQEDLEFQGTDQAEIARQLLLHMQSQPGADLRLTLQGGMSGVLRDRTYLAADKATYGQRLQELSEVEQGLQWRIVPRVEGGSVVREWRWGYPTLGDPDALHVVSSSPHGGDVIAWSIDIDALRGGTRFRTRGEALPSEDTSEPQTPLVSSVHEATEYLAAGWPRIDRTEDRQGVTVQQTLEDYAAYNRATLSGALWVRQVAIAVGARPTITPASLGEAVRVVLVDEWHPRRDGGASYAVTHRLIGVEVQPTTRGRDKETMTLLLGEVIDE